MATYIVEMIIMATYCGDDHIWLPIVEMIIMATYCGDDHNGYLLWR